MSEESEKKQRTLNRELRRLALHGFEKGKKDGLEGLKALLAAGARAEGGGSPTHFSAMEAAARFEAPAEALALLLEAGASLSDRDTEGLTPLSHAAIEGQTKKVLELIRLGADIDALDNEGLTARELAICHGNEETALALGQARADKEARAIAAGLDGRAGKKAPTARL